MVGIVVFRLYLQLLAVLVVVRGAPDHPGDPIPVGDPRQLQTLLLPLLAPPRRRDGGAGRRRGGGGGAGAGGGGGGDRGVLVGVLLAQSEVGQLAPAGGHEQESLAHQLAPLLGRHGESGGGGGGGGGSGWGWSHVRAPTHTHFPHSLSLRPALRCSAPPTRPWGLGELFSFSLRAPPGGLFPITLPKRERDTFSAEERTD